MRRVADAQARAGELFLDVAVGADGRPAVPDFADGGALVQRLARGGAHGTVDCLGAVEGPDGGRLLFRSRRGAAASLHALAPSFVGALEGYVRDAAPAWADGDARHDAAVWRVPLDDGRAMALKLVEAGDPEARALLFREHEFLRAVCHPLVPRPHGWAVERGRYYLLHDWIDGERLAGAGAVDRLADLAADAARRVAFCDGLAGLLRSLEAAGIEHRDIREDNVILRGADPVLINFGNARWRDETDVPALRAPPASGDAVAVDALIARVLG
jgi:serine/threonine protein kinase